MKYYVSIILLLSFGAHLSAAQYNQDQQPGLERATGALVTEDVKAKRKMLYQLGEGKGPMVAIGRVEDFQDAAQKTFGQEVLPPCCSCSCTIRWLSRAWLAKWWGSKSADQKTK